MNLRSETDVLAGMMGADSRRIADLVETGGGANVVPVYVDGASNWRIG